MAIPPPPPAPSPVELAWQREQREESEKRDRALQEARAECLHCVYDLEYKKAAPGSIFRHAQDAVRAARAAREARDYVIPPRAPSPAEIARQREQGESPENRERAFQEARAECLQCVYDLECEKALPGTDIGYVFHYAEDAVRAACEAREALERAMSPRPRRIAPPELGL